MNELEMLKRQQKEIKNRIAELERRENGLVWIKKIRGGKLYCLTFLAKIQNDPRTCRSATVCMANDRQYMKDRICALVEGLQKCYQELEAEDSAEQVSGGSHET